MSLPVNRFWKLYTITSNEAVDQGRYPARFPPLCPLSARMPYVFSIWTRVYLAESEHTMHGDKFRRVKMPANTI